MKIISSLLARLKGPKEIVPYLNDDRVSVTVDEVVWSTVNIGTDDNHPAGRLFSLAEALQMENEQWRLPTLEEVMELKKHQRTSNARNQISGIWFNFSSENSLFFPMNFMREKEGFLPRLIGAYWTRTPDYPGHYIYEIVESYYTWSPAPTDMKVGVRLVRKNATKKEQINELPTIAIDFVDKLRKEKIESMRDCNEIHINSTFDVSSFVESNSNGGG